MKAQGEQFFRIGAIEVDATLSCIRRDGQERYLRPKAFQLLLYLLEQRQRLVTKEELIEAIWEGTAVTDDALVQLIKEIRRALEDDPRKPQFIKTFPKVGYRFIGAAEERLARSAATLETLETTTVELEYEEETSDHTRLTEPAPLALPAPGPKHRRRKRMLIALLAAALIAAVPVAAYLRLRPTRHPSPELTLPLALGKKSLAVMYFENQSGSRELDWLREGLADILITDLSRSNRLTVLGRQQLHLLLERAGHKETDAIRLDEARDIGRRTRAEAVVMGSFGIIGEKIHIDAQLYDTGSGELLAAERITMDKPSQVLTDTGLLSLKLANRLGAASDDQDAGISPAGVVTNNLEAYRYYSLANEKAEAYHTAEAIELWEKAIALDPRFAMAYARIGYTYTLIRVNESDKGKRYLQKAFQLSERLTERDKLYINTWYAVASGDHTDGIRLLTEIINRYPLEVEAYLRLGYQLHYEDRLEEAIAVYKRALLVDPEAKDLHNALGFSCSGLGRYDEAIAAHQTYVQLAPGEPNAHDSLGMTYLETGRFDEAAAEFERAAALNPNFHFALLHLGDVCFRLGRYRAAAQHYGRFLQYAPSDWDRSVGWHRLVMLDLNKGDLNGAEAAARQELRYKSDLGGPLLVALARGDAKVVENSRQRLLGSSPDVRPRQLPSKWSYYFWGQDALKRGLATEAIQYFKEALRHPWLVWNVDGVEDCLADAYLELGQLDEAIAEYNRLLGINSRYPPALYHLAQAYERKGERELASASYERFLQVWKDADKDLPEVKAATERLVAARLM